MASEQVESAKSYAADTAGQTKQLGQEKTGQAQQHAEGLGQSAQDTAGQAQEFGQEKTGNAGQATHGAAQTAQTKAAGAKDQIGSVLDQAGHKLTDTINHVKGSVKGNK